MKKILIIPHTYSNGGGAEKVLNVLIKQLSQWYKIDIIERWEDNTLVYDLPDNVHKLNSMTYFPHMVATTGKNKLFWSFHRKILSILTILFPRAIYRHYIKDTYDYEISFNYMYSALLIANSPNKKSRKVMWNHSDLYDLDYQKLNGINRFVSFVKFWTQTRAFKKADKVVAISKLTYQSIIDLFPFTKSYATVVFNGYNFNQFKDLSLKFSVKKGDRFRLSFVGRLEARKNVVLAIESVNEVIKSGLNNIEMQILGEGEQRQKAELLAEKNASHFNFLGFQSNPYPYIHSSDALIVTSYTEGFPTVLIEAIALGVPVITTNVGGVEEIVKDGVNGLVVKNDPADIAEKIKYMATHYSQFTYHIEDTVKQYTAENWGKNVRNLLESL